METSHPLESSPFAEYIPAIGWVCMQWTNLEEYLNTLLLSLIPTDSNQMNFLAESRDVGYLITYRMEFRRKIEIVQRLSFIRRQQREEWYEKLKTLLKRAEELREKRNNYVHDLWFTEDEMIRQLYRRKNELKPGKPLELTMVETPEVTVSEIWATADAIGETAQEIYSLAQDYQVATFASRPPMIDTVSSS